MEVKVVNIHDYHGEYIYVGRGSPLGNPFSDKPSKFDTFKVSSRDEAIDKYKLWLEERLKFNTVQSQAFNECLDQLISKGKIVLGCFCVPKRCHAEVISGMLIDKASSMDLEWKEYFE